MDTSQTNMNNEVTTFLDNLNHPLRKEIEQLRLTILSANSGLSESIKWNAPNYSYKNEDRVTMKLQPTKQIQLIFHRGAKKLIQPTDKIIDIKSTLLVWKENDRAIVSFKNIKDIEESQSELKDIVSAWIEATIKIQ